MPNPVYVDLSPVARDGLVRAREMAAGGNLAQAARELQKLLDEHADRVAPVSGEPELFRSVRQQVHRTLLTSPDLLAQYLAAEQARASEMLSEGTLAAARRVESTRLLTDAGFESALRVAQAQLESACFEAARLTLEQLEDHPLRRRPDAREAGRQAAELLIRVARYLDPARAELRERAARWAREAGLEGTDTNGNAERPPALSARVTDVWSPAPALDAAAVPTRPLWSGPVEPPAAPDDPPGPADARGLAQRKDPENLWVLPSVAGDTLYINDGTWITARDRFTLQLRWAVEPGGGAPEDEQWTARQTSVTPGASRSVEDTTSVTLAGRIVVATTGIGRDGSRDGDPRTHALDADTGRALWSVHVPGLDPQLESGSVRGPALVDGDTVVVVVRKTAMARRIVSVYLAGLELRTGTLKWIRLIASAGALPFNRERRISDACTLDQGVVYLCDQLGAAAAVEAATGRPVWLRRMPVAGVADTSFPWRWSSPVAAGPAVFLLSPDHRELLRIDRAGGEVLASRGSGILGDPDYILRVGDSLAAVGDAQVAFLPLEDIENGQATLSRTIPDPGIRGRVVVAGDRLLVPRADGVSVVDPAQPKDPYDLRLDASGTVLPVESQLLVVDAREVHSYLAWPVAQSILRDRMAASPNDPEPACTYAELAYRAGRTDEVAPAADKALAAIERDPAANAALRTRLFEVLREMVDASQERWARAAPADPRTPALDQAALSAVIERLGRAAQTPEDRLTHLMALGRLREAELSPALAAEAYQKVLADTALSAAAWRGPGVRVRAEIEAAGRIRRLLIEHGSGVYAAFDAEAAIALSALGPAPAPEDLESLARRYPGAADNAALWLRIADQRDRAGRSMLALEALREGLAAAELSRLAGRRTEPGVEGELAGRLLTEMLGQERAFTASRLLATLRADRPDLILTNRGTTIDALRLSQDLSARLAAFQRLPRVGPVLRPEVQSLDGWSIMTAESREGAPAPCEHLMLISVKAARVALWGIPGAARLGATPDGGANGAESPQHIAMLWSREYTGEPPGLLRVDPESVYLIWDAGEQGWSVERIDAVTGQTRWRTEPLRTLFAAESGHRERLELDGLKIETPIDGVVAPRDAIAAIDSRALVLAERIGRIAAFDPATGRLLWKKVAPVSRVYDVDAAGGLVVIGGVAGPDNPAAGRLSHQVAVYDARTGEVIRTIDDLATPIQWLRLVPATGEPAPGLLLATQTQIIALDPERATTKWEILGEGAADSIDAWVFGERMFVLNRKRELWLVSLSAGRCGDTALETFGRFLDNWPITAVEIPGDSGQPNVAFLSKRGVVVFDPGKPGSPPVARLVGIDALARSNGPGAFPDAVGDQDLVTPVPCRGLFVTMEGWPTRLPDGRPAYALHLLDSATGKLQGVSHNLVLWDAPRRLAVLDGRIIVTAGASGSVTMVYSAPELDR